MVSGPRTMEWIEKEYLLTQRGSPSHGKEAREQGASRHQEFRGMGLEIALCNATSGGYDTE